MRFELFALAAIGLGGCTEFSDPQDADRQAGLTGELSEAQPEFRHAFQLVEGQIATIITESAENLDTELAIVGPIGKPLAQNDDADASTLQSRIIFLAPETAEYTAVVTGYDGATGSFALIVTEGLDFGLSEDAVVLDEGPATFTETAPSHELIVDVAAGDILVASTEALTATLDTTLSLIDASGVILAQNDDRGDGSLNSQIVFQVEHDGTYTVQASSYSGSDEGELFVSVATDPNAEPPFDFTAIEGEHIATTQGQIDDASPEHRVPVMMNAGQTLYAYADAVSGDLDPVLRLLGPDGSPVAMNDDRGDGSLNSAFAFTAREAGEYVIEVDRYGGGGSSGEFSLNLSWVDESVIQALQALRESIVALSGEAAILGTRDFAIHYTDEGEDASTRAYAVTVGDALQHALSEQIDRMGWREPVRDGDGLYRAFIKDAGGAMGVTYPVETVFDNPHSADVREALASRTVFVIENDFEGFDEKTAPVDSLMRATATHEFAHVVQFGYDSEEGLDWLYEATASWIEVATVGHHQDASDYVETDYEQPELCWTTSESGFDYSQWTLLQSLADVYGEGLIVDIWENAVEHDGFETMEVTLNSVGTTIPDVLQRWRAQNFARAYELAPLFDRSVALNRSFEGAELWTSKGGPQELGASYFELAFIEPHDIRLDGDGSLQAIALGYRDDAVDVIPLGSSGVVDPGGYEYLGLMVFNAALPEAPGICSSNMFSLELSPSTDRAMAEVAYRFDAPHFQPPASVVDEAVEDEESGDGK
jgi:GTP cyclohydrolase II